MGARIVFQEMDNLFVNGINDCKAYPKFWIVALVQMNCEKQVEAKLNKLRFETYLSIQKEEHQWSDRKKKYNYLDGSFCACRYRYNSYN